jgi:hypothetical protein
MHVVLPQKVRGVEMENNSFKKYYLFSLAGVICASFYPLYMGLRVILDMISYGTVQGENYPKYIIPYTPISIAVLVGVLLMPLILDKVKKLAVLLASGISFAVFLIAEMLFENMVIVTTGGTSSVENWQMYLCAVPPEGFATRTWTTVNILGGEFDPMYKIHFYVISAVLILSILTCLYGFGHMIRTGDARRKKTLISLSVASGLFLGLCIFACFTAFFRGGELLVSPLSAWLMTVFFVTLGVTGGLFAGTFLQGKRKVIAVVVPSLIAIDMTIIMYIGELILLHGNLYRFGTGFLFEKFIFLAPIDYLIVLLSGGITAAILMGASRRSGAKTVEESQDLTSRPGGE